jgi:hypothetical protein
MVIKLLLVVMAMWLGVTLLGLPLMQLKVEFGLYAELFRQVVLINYANWVLERV